MVNLLEASRDGIGFLRSTRLTARGRQSVLSQRRAGAKALFLGIPIPRPEGRGFYRIPRSREGRCRAAGGQSSPNFISQSAESFRP